ncbi:hypothetical protein LBW89_09250 [Paenibacillus sp. alder61]|uniref:Crp/Fnr family transcriptional regulator n=1 Tax=Paenibacillus sp. alder61 TaxID=2862948 RepID=UPI001CD2000F|nr:hypothetical protein [Paenibacillus sp. alder61]MCA1293205.1 hypothetical protein [Paenibacillus sp. alder61]
MHPESEKPNHHYLPLLNKVSVFSFAEADWNTFVERTVVKKVGQGTRIVEAGQRVHHAYFCSEGLFRLFYLLPDGREYNVAFSLEQDFATSYGSMVKGEAMHPGRRTSTLTFRSDCQSGGRSNALYDDCFGRVLSILAGVTAGRTSKARGFFGGHYSKIQGTGERALF